VAALCLFDAAAALLWALFASVLGYFGGKAFEGTAWKGLLLALGIAFAVAGGVEIVRWCRGRSRAGNRLEPDV
jgi:membrane protein DedA with SNARE-associated domain